jgi:hypothetical protein
MMGAVTVMDTDASPQRPHVFVEGNDFNLWCCWWDGAQWRWDSSPKPIHFDDSEHMWSVGAVANAFDVETVALHEIGHILGLEHTTVAGAVMFPWGSPNSTLRVLQTDDLEGIRSLYPPA